MAESVGLHARNWSLVSILGVAILLVSLPAAQGASTGKSYVLDSADPSVAAICSSLRGSWDSASGRCTINSSLVLNSTDSLTVKANAALTIVAGVKLTSAGNITIYGTAGIGGLTNNGVFTIFGDVGIENGPVTNSGVLINPGNLYIYPGFVLTNSKTMNNTGNLYNAGTLTNTGTISNPGSIFNSCTPCGYPQGGIINNNGAIINSGTISNPCGGVISNKGTISGNPVTDACHQSSSSTTSGTTTSVTTTNTSTTTTSTPSPSSTTTSSISSTTVTFAPTQSTTSSTGATTTTATQSGGIPEFPYQMLGVGILALIMTMSYLTARQHTERANRLVVTT